jgi:hypothetical protein
LIRLLRDVLLLVGLFAVLVFQIVISRLGAPMCRLWLCRAQSNVGLEYDDDDSVRNNNFYSY